jgi:hypothetical protein
VKAKGSKQKAESGKEKVKGEAKAKVEGAAKQVAACTPRTGELVNP